MGESSALFLAKAGCGSAIVDIDESRAKNVAAKVAALGVKSSVVIGNVLKDDEVDGIIERAEKEMGKLDVLVNIVGAAHFAKALDITPADWDMELQRNLRYAFFVTQAFAKRLVSSGRPGAIVCIASISGLQSAPNHSPYGVAKLGLVNLVRSLSIEWAEHGIRINAIAPGLIDTPRMTPVFAKNKPLVNLVPMKRPGIPDEIGKTVLFLSSDLASYITGSTVPVDGGWMANNLVATISTTA